jgi:hypothetical protein
LGVIPHNKFLAWYEKSYNVVPTDLLQLCFIAFYITLQINKKWKNHSTQDSRVVPHRGTNWAALWLTAQIGRDAVLSESYGRG